MKRKKGQEVKQFCLNINCKSFLLLQQSLKRSRRPHQLAPSPALSLGVLSFLRARKQVWACGWGSGSSRSPPTAYWVQAKLWELLSLFFGHLCFPLSFLLMEIHPVKQDCSQCPQSGLVERVRLGGLEGPASKPNSLSFSPNQSKEALGLRSSETRVVHLASFWDGAGCSLS